VETDYCMAMTTTEDEDSAATLARQVVEAQLAACVQIVRIRSVFVWDGAVNDTPEQLLLIKTRTDVYRRLEALIHEHHPYDVPEILQVPVIGGFASYLAWVDEMARGTAG
jgi:periplasmic divalent cation tolerance protein